MSMSMAQAKGLLNMPGQNNCFLNSAVQVLWHLDIFRRSFRELSGHACMGSESCIFCALKELFTEFQYSQETALPPDSLRKALAETFSDQRRFQLGFMDDAAECFENILLRIHGHIAINEAEDNCSAPHCISHEKFAMNLVEQIICSACGATSEPLPFTQMVHYVSSPALCLQAKKYANLRVSFGQLLRCGEAYGNVRDCPSGCGARIQIRKTLVNRPDIVSIGLVWDSERPALNLITDVFRLIGTSLNLEDVFDCFGPGRSRSDDSKIAPQVATSTASSSGLQLVGLVTYYGKHYSTFFYHTKLCSWIYFDDATVREIGPHWEQVIDRCIKGHFQPLLLLYANPNGTAINANTAPKAVTMVSHQHNGRKHHIRHFHPHHNHQPHLQHNDDYNNTNIYQNIINLTTRKDSSVQALNEKLNRPPPLTINSATCNMSERPKRGQRIYETMRQPKRCLANYNQHQKPGSLDDLANTYASTSDDAPDSPMMRSSISSSCYFSDMGETDSGYISRRAVENILAAQKYAKQNSVKGHQRSSISSVDSFHELPVKKNCEDNHLLVQAKACSLQRRDSGNSSNGSNGDRFSASSNSSTTSREDTGCPALPRRSLSKSSNNPSSLANADRKNGHAMIDQGYDSFSLSSSDSYPSIGQTTPPKVTSTQFNNHARLSQIPEDNQLIELLNSASLQDCDKLCNESDLLLIKSIEKEREGDLVAAAALSDSAAHKARSAMAAPYSNSQMLISAKMKHSICVMRSANLHKRLKEMEAEEKRRIKMEAVEASLAGHSRQNSRDSGHGRHSRQNSKDGPTKENKKESKEAKKNCVPDYANGKAIQLYGTLPKKSLSASCIKKRTLSPSSSVTSSNNLASQSNGHHNVAKEDLTKRTSMPTMISDALRGIRKGANMDMKSDVESICSSRSAAHRSIRGHHVRDSDLSDNYYSEWEAIRENKSIKKDLLKRSLSGLSGNSGSTSVGGKSSETDTYNDVAEMNGNSSSKKQHKIRRKLLIGSFMKRKNRSLPDLRENCQPEVNGVQSKPAPSDDLMTPKTVAKISRKGFHQGMGIYQRPSSLKVDSPVKDPFNTDKLSKSLQSSSSTSLPNKPCQASSTTQLHPIPFTQQPPPPPPPPPPKIQSATEASSGSFTRTQVKQPESCATSFRNMVPRAPTPPRPRAEESLESCQVVTTVVPTTKYSQASLHCHTPVSTATSPPPPPPQPQPQPQPLETVYKPASPSLGIEANELLPPPPEIFLQELREKRDEMKNNSLLGRLTSERLENHCDSGVDQVDSCSNANNSPNSDSTSNSLESEKRSTAPRKQVLSETSQATCSPSVKDLASRFQNMNCVNAFHQPVASHQRTSSSSSQQTVIFNPRSSLNHKNLSSSNSSISTSNSATVSHCPSPTPSSSSSSSLRQGLRVVALLGSSIRNNSCDSQYSSPKSNPIPSATHSGPGRPGRPPDYETALKRLNQQRAEVNGKVNGPTKVFPVIFTPQPVNGSSPPKSTSLREFYRAEQDEKPQVLEAADTRRKELPKKSVSFSDQIELVAPAEDDEEDYLPNPLLDRVLGKKVTS